MNNPRTPTKQAIDVDIDHIETRLAANGRESLFLHLENNGFSFPIFSILVFVRVINIEQVRLLCDELTDRQLAEYIIFIMLQFTAGLSKRHGVEFFHTPGILRCRMLLDVWPFEKAHEMINAVRCDQAIDAK